MPTILRKLNPLAGLDNPKEVWAWGMFDLANQSFTLLIITLLFPLYFKQVVVGEPIIQRDVAAILAETDLPNHDQLRLAAELADLYADSGENALESETSQHILEPLLQKYPNTQQQLEQAFTQAADTGDWRWGIVVSGSLLLVVIVSPILGALADARAWRKEILITVGLLCCAATMALGLVGPGHLLLAVILFILGNIGYQLSENFLAAFLPSISTRQNIGRVSAIGWSMGYLGALGLLTCFAAAIAIFGVDAPTQWKPFFVFAGIWFLVGMLPTIRILRDDAVIDPAARGNVIAVAFARLADTIKHASRYKQLSLFLAAFLIYGFGIQAVINFASILAADFGIDGPFLVVYVIVITVTAGASAFATSTFQDRIGTKNTLLIFLALWLIATLGLIAIEIATNPPAWSFWVVGNGIGLGLGGAGPVTRAIVGQFTPRQRAAEFFGLWGLTNKLAGAIGVPIFAAVKANTGDLASLITLAAFFLVGSAVVMFVNVRAGILAARYAEREWARELRAAPIKPP